MAKNIIDIVREKKGSLQQRPAEAGVNMTLGIAAVKGGIKSAAWKSYMMQFVEQDPPGTPVDPAQLARLLATDGTDGDPILDRQRAYLVANAACGPTTADRFDYGVEGIDFGLATAPPTRFQDCDTGTGIVAGLRARQAVARKAAKKGYKKKGAKKR
jgi:hypothetical protein